MHQVVILKDGWAYNVELEEHSFPVYKDVYHFWELDIKTGKMTELDLSNVYPSLCLEQIDNENVDKTVLKHNCTPEIVFNCIFKTRDIENEKCSYFSPKTTYGCGGGQDFKRCDCKWRSDLKCTNPIICEEVTKFIKK